MDSVSGERGWTRARTWAELDQRLSRSLAAAGPPLLFGLRIWASLCLALYLAFWLQLDNADWAGTTALIVCQPQLGASLRKGWYRLIGTVIGAVMIVVVTALFRRLPSKLMPGPSGCACTRTSRSWSSRSGAISPTAPRCGPARWAGL